MNPKSIKIDPKLSHNQFGCNEPIFEAHVKGKDLPVIDYENGFYVVLVGDELYTVPKEDVARMHH